jgi:hypothetical protein
MKDLRNSLAYIFGDDFEEKDDALTQEEAEFPEEDEPEEDEPEEEMKQLKYKISVCFDDGAGYRTGHDNCGWETDDAEGIVHSCVCDGLTDCASEEEIAAAIIAVAALKPGEETTFDFDLGDGDAPASDDEETEDEDTEDEDTRRVYWTITRDEEN